MRPLSDARRRLCRISVLHAPAVAAGGNTRRDEILNSENNPRELFKRIVAENPAQADDRAAIIEIFVAEMLKDEHLDALKEVLRRWGTKIYKSNTP
jgi:hypothetical protein